MQPFSYTSLKIVHEQQIQEALEHQRHDAEQKASGKGLLQAFRAFPARFSRHSAQKQERSFSDSVCEVECVAS